MTTSPRTREPDAPFPPAEYAKRRAALQSKIREKGWSVLIVSNPANVYYLTGLNSYGYFSTTLLAVPAEGEAMLLARRFEGTTVVRQCWDTRFVGLSEDDDIHGVLIRELESGGYLTDPVGIEQDNMFLPPSVLLALRDGMAAPLEDGSGMVESLRVIKSPAEIELTRQAASVSQIIAEAAFDVAREGVNEREVAAQAHRVMIESGSEASAIPPLIRSTETLWLSHTSWRDRALQKGDVLFVEVSGSVGRYHAPHTRLAFVGERPDEAVRANSAAIEGLHGLADAIKPGVTAGSAYAAWFEAMDAAGMPQDARTHVGYSTGIGFPPTWMVLSGGSTPDSLRPTSSAVLQEGMVFHIFSWVRQEPPNVAALTDTVIVTADGCEILTATDRELRVL